jgi:hypothetical protein
MESSRYAATGHRPRRLSTETKNAFKTTEFVAYVVILLGLFIAAAVTDDLSDFGAQEVWLYAVILTVGYMVSRGLAKSGSRDPYWDDPAAGDDGSGVTDRLKAAAQVLKDGEPATRSEATTHTPEQRY